MKQKFFICKHCGNIVAMIRDKGVPVVCCGEKMLELIRAGAQVLHDRSVELAKEHGIRVEVLSSVLEEPGTVVCPSEAL